MYTVKIFNAAHINGKSFLPGQVATVDEATYKFLQKKRAALLLNVNITSEKRKKNA